MVVENLRPILSDALPPNPERRNVSIAHMTGDNRFLDGEDGYSLLLRKDGSFQEMGWPPKTDP
jgi:hypothetical protein